MDLNSRWDRIAVTLLVFSIIAMTGCQGLSGGSSSPNGALSLGSASLSFGTVVVGSSKTMTDPLTNNTSAFVMISGVTVSDPEFKVVSPAFPMTLSPKQSVNLMLSFTPSAVGSPSAKVALAGGTNGATNFAVSGSAIDAGKLVVNPATVTFGSVRVGQSLAKTATLTNSGESSVTVAQASASNAAFTFTGLTLPMTLAPGQSTSFSVVFVPKSAGQVSGSVSMQGQASLMTGAAAGSSGDPSTPTTASVTVSGAGTTAGQLTLIPASVAFGSVNVGTSQSLTVSISNSSGTSATITAAAVTGPGFSLSTPVLPMTLAAGQSTTLKVAFSPTKSGAASGTLTVDSNASDGVLTAGVTGTGTTPGALTASPATLNFGNVAIGTKQSQPASLTNSGGASITVSQAVATGAGFSLSGLNLPMTLASGQTAGFTVTFAPQSAGSASGSIGFSGTMPAATMTLAGFGLASGSLSANPASVNFGSVQVGTPQSQTVSLTNGGTAAAVISAATSTGAGFSITGLTPSLTIQPGQSASFTVTFTPGAAASDSGNVSITSNASNPTLNIPLSGTGTTVGALVANPTSVTFTGVPIGSTQTKSEVISNSGGSSITISSATVTGTGFATSGLSVPTTLNGGQSLTFNITFTPQSSTSASGSLALSASGSVPNLSIALSGTGSSPGTLSVSPASVNFGNVTVGANQSQSGTLTASGSGVTISSAASSNAEFALSGLTLPLNLGAGQSAGFTVTFTPTTSGATSGSISFTSNATNASLAQAVSGTGTGAVQHSVSLSWIASTSTVVGYNIYRGSQNGGPYSAINTGNAGTTYTDSTVQAGQTYYYVVTAVDSAGNESVDSNQAQAVVPTP
jgi:Abnormal spindle-like microcephaly-assoc'd, ASPM-SPD-2-Hydin/Cep192 domain 4